MDFDTALGIIFAGSWTAFTIIGALSLWDEFMQSGGPMQRRRKHEVSAKRQVPALHDVEQPDK